MALAYVAERAVVAASTLVFSPASNCTAGNLLILIFANTGNFVVSGVSDNAGGNTWTVDQTRANGSLAAVSICSVVLTTAILTSNTITVTLSGAGTARGGLLEEFSGSATTPFDVGANNTGASSTSMTTGTTASTAQADELLIEGFCVQASGRTFTKDAAFADFTTHQSDRMGGAYEIVAAAGTQSGSGAFSGVATNWAGAIATYKAAAAAGGFAHSQAIVA